MSFEITIVTEDTTSVVEVTSAPTISVDVSTAPQTSVIEISGSQGPAGPQGPPGPGGAITVTDTNSVDLDLTADVLTANVRLSGSTLAVDGSGLKLADFTPDRALQSGVAGVIEVSSVTATELGYVSGVTSAIQTQINSKLGTTLPSANVFVGNGSNVATAVAVSGDISISNLGVTAISTGVIVDADINAAAAISFSKLATLSSGNILVGSSGGVATSVAMSGDITISNAGVTAIGSGVIVNADVNASAAIALSKLAALTASRALVSDGSGFVSVSTTTATEIGYVNGVTSSIQTQLDARWKTAGNASLSSPKLGTTDAVDFNIISNNVNRIFFDATNDRVNFLGAAGAAPAPLSGRVNIVGPLNVAPNDSMSVPSVIYLSNEPRHADIAAPLNTREVGIYVDVNGAVGITANGGSGYKLDIANAVTDPSDTYIRMPTFSSSAVNTWVFEDCSQTLTNKTISAASNTITGINAFGTITTDTGTSPVASGFGQTLAITSSDGTVLVSGNSTTDTVTLTVPSAGGARSIYVSKNGNDTTGNGSYFKPYLTITKALAVATGATAADPYFIYIYPGAYTETSGFKFKSFCHMMGIVMGGNPVQITCSGGIGSDLLGASPVVYMENLQLMSAVTMRPDSTATGSAVVKPNHCQFVSTLEVSRSTSCQMSFTLENNSFTEGAMTIKSAYVEFDYSFALSSITCTHVGGAAMGELGMYGAFFTSISMNNSGSSGGTVVLASSGSYYNGGTISITGSGASLNSDADSLPLLASNVTLAGGATMTLLTTAYSIGYTPTTSSDWVATAPVSVLQGLDDLAKRWATGTFTGTTITQNTKAIEQVHTYNGASAQVFGATGFGTIANFKNGTRIVIIGTHATNTLTLNNTDATNGYLLKSTAILVKGSAITLVYNSTLARMVEVSRSI